MGKTIKRRVLVVEDERLVADTLGLIFEKNGFDCRIAYTGVEALACADNFSPELLLCDISMPGMSGLDIATALTEKCPECRVIFLTAHYNNLGSARKWTRTHGKPSLVITKPLLPALLLQEVDALLLGKSGDAA